jgi:hypothetical protein
MKLSGCDKMAIYQKKTRKKKAHDNAAALATALKLLSGDVVDGSAGEAQDVNKAWECTIVGACRSKKGAVQVAVLWEAEHRVTEASWIDIGDLVNTLPGTENHKSSFGQDREGELIIVQWESTRRYVAELQSWNWDEDNFNLVYEAQDTNTMLKTTQTDKQTHTFRLDSLETDISDAKHHSWWVLAQHAAKPFITQKLKVDMHTCTNHVNSDATISSGDSSTDDDKPITMQKVPMKRSRAQSRGAKGRAAALTQISPSDVAGRTRARAAVRAKK